MKIDVRLTGRFYTRTLGHRKNPVKNEQKLIFLFLLKIEIEIRNSFFDLIMKTKNKKISKFYLILKQRLNVPFDPRITMPVRMKCFS